MYKTSIKLLLVMAIIFVGCSEKSTVEPNDVFIEKRLDKLKGDNQQIIFTYNDNFLLKYENKLSDDQIQTITFLYNDDKKVIEELNSGHPADYRKVFKYDSYGKIDSYDFGSFLNGNFNKHGHLKFYYNTKNQITKTEQFTNENKKWVITNYNYNNQNVAEIEVLIHNKLYEKSIFSYDDKINPYYKFNKMFLYPIAMSKNNVIYSKVIKFENDKETIIETSYQFEYDKHNYPIRRNIISNVDNILEDEFEYEYTDI